MTPFSPTRLCRVVVLALLVSGFVSGREETDPEPITVVFYNVKNYLAMDRRIDGEVFENAGKLEAEVNEVVGAILLTAPDILSICETGDESFLEDLQKRLAEGGLDLPHSELVRDSAGYDRNLAVLSRFPIVTSESRDDYTYTLEGKKMAHQRGVIDTKFVINPQYHLRVIGLHLKSKREVPEADQALMRLNEARLAREHIDRHFDEEPGANILVVGDFNDLRIEPPVKALQGGFGRDGFLSSLTLSDQYGFRWTHHWSYADSYARFDYALTSKGLSPEIERDESYIYHWEKWDTASDHRPIVVRITPKDR